MDNPFEIQNKSIAQQPDTGGVSSAILDPFNLSNVSQNTKTPAGASGSWTPTATSPAKIVYSSSAAQQRVTERQKEASKVETNLNDLSTTNNMTPPAPTPTPNAPTSPVEPSAPTDSLADITGQLLKNATTPVDYFTTDQGKADMDTINKAKASLGLTIQEEAQIGTEASAQVNAAYDPMIRQAQEEKRQGMPKAVIAGGEAGGFINTQIAGRAALQSTEGGDFVGVGGQLERVKSAYDSAISNLFTQKESALQNAISLAKQAKLTGKKSDYDALVQAVNTAKDNYSQVQKMQNERLTVLGNLQKISQTTSNVSSLMKKYPDAGITSSDSEETAQAKLQTSALYQKAVNMSTNIDKLIVKYPDAGLMAGDTPEQVQEKLNKSSLYNKSIVSIAGGGGTLTDSQQNAVSGLLSYYRTTGQLPSLARLSTAERQAFWSSVGQAEAGGTDVVSQAVANKATISSMSKAIGTQQNQLSATKTALGTLDNQLDLLVEYSNKVDRSGSPLINKYLLYAKGQYAGDADTKAFENIVATASNEFAKILSGSAASIAGVTVSSAAEAKSILNSNMNPQQIKAVVDLMKKEGQFRIKNQEQEIQNITKDLGSVGKQTANSDPLGLGLGGNDTSSFSW